MLWPLPFTWSSKSAAVGRKAPWGHSGHPSVGFSPRADPFLMLPKRAIGQVSSHSVVLESPLAFWVSVSRTVAHRSSSPAATATSLFIVLFVLRCCKSLHWKYDFNVSKFFGNDWNLMCKQRPSVDVVRQMCWLC